MVINMSKKVLTWIVVVGLLFLTGCTTAKGDSTQRSTNNGALPTDSQKAVPKIRIAAAADLTLAFQEIAAQFAKDTGITAEITFGSTGTAAMQIENGAPYDIFAAADTSYIDKLREKGLILPDSQQLYAQGRIGIATPKNKPTIQSLQELAANPSIKKIAIADPSHAPYGRAAKEAFEHSNTWEQVKNKLVYGKNIQDTLAIMQSGNVDAAIIALSIYKPEEVNFSLIDPSLHSPLNQALAILKSTQQEEKARQFIAYVNGEKGRKIMKKYGFLLPGEW